MGLIEHWLVERHADGRVFVHFTEPPEYRDGWTVSGPYVLAAAADSLAGAVDDLDEAIKLLNDARPDYVDSQLRRQWARKRKALVARHPRGR
jgi:hypothetical protein